MNWKVFIVVMLFVFMWLCSSVVSAAWYSSDFGYSITVDLPPSFEWYSSDFGFSVVVEESPYSWYSSSFGFSVVVFDGESGSSGYMLNDNSLVSQGDRIVSTPGFGVLLLSGAFFMVLLLYRKRLR